MTSLERDIGNLEARMETVEQELHAIRQDVRDIRDALVSAKGGWRTLLVVISLATTLGAFVDRIIPQWSGLKP